MFGYVITIDSKTHYTKFHIKTNLTTKSDRVNDSTIRDEYKLKIYKDYIIGTSGQLKKVHLKDIHIYEADVSSSEQAHNLGIIFDKEMNSKAQINNISKAGYYHVRNLAMHLSHQLWIMPTLYCMAYHIQTQKFANGSKCISQGINTSKEI